MTEHLREGRAAMTSPQTVLVTGGAGFIGSHTCLELLEAGYEVVSLDNYSNSSPVALDRVQKLAGRPLTVYEGDVRDAGILDMVFDRYPIDVVVHFAAKKAVGESVRMPLAYWDINVGGTISLVEAMVRHGVRDLVFSSSCSIYGEADTLPITEESPARPTNPYARSKWVCEQFLRDVTSGVPEMSVICLRYFNPVGAHPSGELGEDPTGVPNNVMPYAMQVAVGRLESLTIFGDDYATVDGTGVRDYIHVVDLARGHRMAIDHRREQAGIQVFNLGTGVGTSVRQLVAAVESAAGAPIAWRSEGRREGDVAELVADPTLVAQRWGWRTEKNVKAMCEDAWRFQQANPEGYRPRGTTTSTPRSAL